MKVGIAGVGRMGAAMAARLMEGGHSLTVWNRTPEKTRPLAEAGAQVAPTPAALASQVEAVITILMDADAIDTVYSGREGLLSGDVAGKLLIDMSTVLPETEKALAEKVRANGAAFVECPVGGTVGPARQGKLLGMAGGEAADVERARPILDQLCRIVEHVGPIGNGAAMKLAINLPLLLYWQSMGEALSLVRGLGLDPHRMIDFFKETSGAATALKGRGGDIADALSGTPPGPGAFTIAGGRKDLATMLAQGRRLGVDMPLVENAIPCFEEAIKAGWGDHDNTVMPVYWSGRGGAKA